MLLPVVCVTVSIQLPSDICIAEADELKSSILETLSQEEAQEGAVTLFADAVVRVDTAGIQLLLSVVKKLEAEGRDMAWSGVSGPLMDAAYGLGVAEILKLPTA